MKLRLTALAMLLLSVAWSASADLESAQQAVAWGDYELAVRQFVELAEAGDAEAQFQLGKLYREGTGVDRNAETAVQWFRQSADQGHADAQYALGTMHLTGEGVFKDDVWAINWYRKAAQQGHPQAQQDLTRIYSENGLTPPDWSQTVAERNTTVEVQTPQDWQQIDSEAGPQAPSDEQAAIEAAKSHGIEVEYSAVEEAESAPQDEVAPIDTAAVVDEGDAQIAQSVEPQSTEAIADASDTAEAAAQPGGVSGWFGKLFKRDAPAEPIVSDTAAREAEIGEAQTSPAHADNDGADEDDFPFGKTAPRRAGGDLEAAKTALIEGNYTDAVRQLTPIARAGNSEAQSLLGTLYQTGQGVEQNLSIAASLYTAAARDGDAEAQFNLANMFLLGEGVVPDDERARYWYAQSAAQGHSGAQRNLSSLDRDDDEVGPSAQAFPADMPAREYESLSEARARRNDPSPQAPASAAVVADVVAESEVVIAPVAAVVEAASEPVAAKTMPAADESSALASANAAYGRGDHASALEEYTRLAQAGDAQAQFKLATMYERGIGVAADDSWAVTWYRRAAAQGHAEANSRLVEIYAEAGIERPTITVAEAQPMAEPEPPQSYAAVDETEVYVDDSSEVEEIVEDAVTAVADTAPVAATAAASTQAAAATGKTASKWSLKRLVGGIFGDDAESEENEEAREPVAAVEPEAPVEIAQPQPVAEASVVTDGYSEAQPMVAINEESTEPYEVEEPIAAEVAAPIVDIEVAKVALAQEDYSTAFEIFTLLAENGDADAQAHLGYLYNAGEGVERNSEEAVRWYKVSAIQGNRDAQYNLAVAYAFGDGVAQDDFEAANWYRRAADAGHKLAQFSLGISYAMGEGVAPDESEAIKWYRLAGEQGYAAAQYNLGFMYRSGRGVARDHVEAANWYLLAANQGHAAAQYSLGYMYRSGKGVPQDTDQAIHWYTLAAQQGYADAHEDLATLTGNRQ